MQIGMGESRDDEETHKPYFERGLREEYGLKIRQQDPAQWNFQIFKRYRESMHHFYPIPNRYEHNFIFTMNINELEPVPLNTLPKSNKDNNTNNIEDTIPVFQEHPNPYFGCIVYGTFQDMVAVLSQERSGEQDQSESDLVIIPYRLAREVTDRIWNTFQGEPCYP